MLKNISIPQRPDGTIYFLFLFFLKTVKILFFLIFIFTLFCFTILYWFCHTLTWICHGCTCVPHPETPSHIPPHTIPLGHPSVSAPSILYPALNLDWRFISYMILYMFQCHSPKSSHPCQFFWYLHINVLVNDTVESAKKFYGSKCIFGWPSTF